MMEGLSFFVREKGFRKSYLNSDGFANPSVSICTAALVAENPHSKDPTPQALDPPRTCLRNGDSVPHRYWRLRNLVKLQTSRIKCRVVGQWWWQFLVQDCNLSSWQWLYHQTSNSVAKNNFRNSTVEQLERLQSCVFPRLQPFLFSSPWHPRQVSHRAKRVWGRPPSISWRQNSTRRWRRITIRLSCVKPSNHPTIHFGGLVLSHTQNI